MTSRTLVCEFQPLIAVVVEGEKPNPPEWEFFPEFETNYRKLRLDRLPIDGYWFAETVIDLSGYQMQDLTMFFRRSFEQVAGPYTALWGDAGVSEFSSLAEQVIISSVPLSEDNLGYSIITGNSPGFMNVGGFSKILLSNGQNPVGTFDRTHIIHGHLQYHTPSTILGSESLTTEGSGFLQASVDEYYSSLEPTAADKLYCYRVLGTNQATQKNPFKQLNVPALRIIIDAVTGEEPHLEYMMRLARSYELANQV